MRGTMPKESRSKVHKLRQPKILSQNIVAHIENPAPHIRIIAALDSQGRLTLDTVNNTISKSPEWPLEVLLALLNSKVYSWYMYRFVYNQAIRTMHFDSEYVGRLPLPELSVDAKHYAVNLVREACRYRARGLEHEFQKVDKELDYWAYKAFRLTDQEICYIDTTTFHGYERGG
jgi:hypothetical protein